MAQKTVENVVENMREALGVAPADIYFREPVLKNVPPLAQLGLYMKYKDQEGYAETWENLALSLDNLMPYAIRAGLLNFTSASMSFNEATPEIAITADNFEKEFREYFSNGRWVVETYNRGDCHVDVSFISYDTNKATFSMYISRADQVPTSAYGIDKHLFLMFSMFGMVPEFIKTLSTLLSPTMITELAAQMFKDISDIGKRSNIREIITLLSEEIENKTKEGVCSI